MARLVVSILALSLLAFDWSWPCSGHASGRELCIVGNGADESSALRDAIGQVHALFAVWDISSETLVEDFVLKRDITRSQADFSGGRLGRFYEGVYRRGERYVAVFRFPGDFVNQLGEKNIGTGRFSFFASFDEIRFSTLSVDSLGERHLKEWSVKVPECVKRFVNLFIYPVEKIGSVRIVRVRR